MFGQAFNLNQSQMTTSQTIDSQFQQIQMLNAAKTAGAAEQRSMDSAMGVQYGNTATGIKPTQQSSLWIGINSGLHALSFLFLPVAGLGLFGSMIVKAELPFLMSFAVVFFFFLAHTIIYESGWGQANLSYSTIPTSSMVSGIVVGGLAAMLLYMNQ